MTKICAWIPTLDRQSQPRNSLTISHLGPPDRAFTSGTRDSCPSAYKVFVPLGRSIGLLGGREMRCFRHTSWTVDGCLLSLGNGSRGGRTGLKILLHGCVTCNSKRAPLPRASRASSLGFERSGMWGPAFFL